MDNQSTPTEWLKKVANGVLPGGDVTRWQVDPQVLFIGRVEWQEGDQLAYANLQALVAESGDLEELYCGKAGVTGHYYRADFDLDCLGPLLAEPQPHVHHPSNRAPRFDVRGSSKLVPAFLEFIFRNHRHSVWLDWTKKLLARKAPDLALDIVRVEQAYMAGKAYVLRDLAPVVQRLRDVLRTEIDGAHRLAVPAVWRELFEGP